MNVADNIELGKRVPFDDATHDYPTTHLHAPLWARSHFLCGRQTGCPATMNDVVM